MAGLQVRELPEQLYQRLVERAQREHRSLAQQAVAILAEGLGASTDPRQRRQQLLERIRGRSRTTRPEEWHDPVQLVREDRQR